MRSLLQTALVLAVLLAGCSSVGPNAPARPARLIVHVGMFGGPMRPDGHMAASNAPAVGEQVVAVAVGRAGRRYTGTTGADGLATLRLPAGRYRVGSGYCGGPRTVTVPVGGSARVDIRCDVP